MPATRSDRSEYRDLCLKFDEMNFERDSTVQKIHFLFERKREPYSERIKILEYCIKTLQNRIL